MKIANSYHHLKGATLSRSERIEKFVLDSILNSDLSNGQRESSAHWEIMHSSTCKAFMHVLAEKRGLNVELARVAGALHDFYVIKTGKYKNHARLGADLVGGILNDTQDYNDQEIAAIVDMVANHSDKHIYSDNPYSELIKDVDVFDCSLYEGTESYYLAKKPFPVCREYFERIKIVRKELGMPLPLGFDVLNDIRKTGRVEIPNGFDDLSNINPFVAALFLGALSSYMTSALPACLQLSYYNGASTLRVINSKSFAQSTIPDWDAVCVLLLRTRSLIQDFSGAGASVRMAAVFDEIKSLAVSLWNGALESDKVRRSASVELSCFECDDSADEKIGVLLDNRVQSVLEHRLETSATDWFFDQKNTYTDSSVTQCDWDLSEKDNVYLDRLARLETMKWIRQLLAVEASTLLERFSGSDPNYYDADIEFVGKTSHKASFVPPLAFLAGEVEHRYSDTDKGWGLLYWPRFKRAEYLRGAEVDTRMNAFEEYLAIQSSN